MWVKVDVTMPHIVIASLALMLFCVTGELDEKTLQVMSLPRCGVKDKVGSGSDSRSKRYALQGNIYINIFTALYISIATKLNQRSASICQLTPE